MGHHHHDNDAQNKIVELNAQEIALVELLPHLNKTEELLYKTALYFFSNAGLGYNAPFKGFLLHGKVGTGKTEVVKQVARKVAFSLREVATVRFVPVDSSVVASPRWGESEAVFQNLFSLVKDLNSVTNDRARIILLFDDIESLLLSRGMNAAREWHYSLNSVLFHLLDDMNPNQSLVFATTNRPGLIDPALTTRLYSVPVSNVPFRELISYANGMMDSILGHNTKKQKVLTVVKERLQKLKSPTIRDCRQIVMIACIEQGALTLDSLEQREASKTSISNDSQVPS